jgi:hypothetical protein
MLRKANNVFSVIVDDNAELAANLPAVGDAVTNSNMNVGAVCLVDMGNRRMDNTAFTALANGDQFRIAQSLGANKPLKLSPAVTVGHYKTSIQKHTPAVQQVSTLGYDGTSGNLPSASDTSYFIKIRKNDNDAANRSQPMSLFGQYKTSGSATQEELAEGLVLNLVKNLSLEPANGYIDVDVLMDEAGVANAGAGTVTTTYGSTQVTFGTDVDAVAVVGDYIRFDESAGASTALTDPVYKVVAMDTTNQIMTLDRPYTGDSLSAVAEGNAVIIANVTAVAADFGIRLVGKPADFDVAAFRNYYANRFTPTFSDNDFTFALTTGARNGSGVWQQVAMDEYMSWGYEGMNEMTSIPPKAREAAVKVPGVGGETALTSRYSTLNIEWTEDISGLVSKAGGQGNVIFHVNLDNTDPLGLLAATASTGEILVEALGLTDTDFDMV